MAKGSNTILYILGGSAIGLGIYEWFAKSKAINALTVVVNSCKLKMGATFIQVSIDLLFTNPTSESLSFKNFIGTVYLDAQTLGNVDIPSATTIKAKGSTIVSLTAAIPNTNILKAASTYLFSKKIPSKGIVRGTVNVGTFSLPVYQEIAFNKPTTPKPTPTIIKKS
jgi:LEA14-like dessication related protein